MFDEASKSTCRLESSIFGFWSALGRQLEFEWGNVWGMMTTLFRGHPEQCIQTHPLLQKQILLRRGLCFRGVGEPLPRTAGIFFMLLDVALQDLWMIKAS